MDRACANSLLFPFNVELDRIFPANPQRFSLPGGESVICRLTHQNFHLLILRLGFNPRRGIDRISDGRVIEPFRGSDRSEDRVSGIQADSDPKVIRAQVPEQILVVVDHPQHPDGDLNAAVRMIRLNHRGSEQDHQAVADVLIDDPPPSSMTGTTLPK